MDKRGLHNLCDGIVTPEKRGKGKLRREELQIRFKPSSPSHLGKEGKKELEKRMKSPQAGYRAFRR